MTDWINVIEAGYDLSSTRQRWLGNLLDKAAPLMDHGVGVNAQIFRVSATCFSLIDVEVWGAATPQALRAFLESTPPHVIDAVYRRGAPVGSLSEWLFPNDSYAEQHFIQNVPANFQDSFGLVAHTGDGWGLVLAVPLLQPQRMGKTERNRWSKIAAHLAAGLRLRQRLDGLDLNAGNVEAIMTPNGCLEHAQDTAKSLTVRERLRTAVQQKDRARTSTQRQDVDAALALWEGLVAGRWSLIDHFDSDQRRYVVAIKNDPGTPDPRGLSLRERQIAEFFGLGRQPKEIAYILGLSASTVANTLTRTQNKLGMTSKAELAAFFSPSGMRAHLQEIDLANEQIAIGAQPLADEKKFSVLTEAEREVSIELLRGATYTAIAIQRGTTERTIANQTQAIYRKLGVNSRLELGVVLSTT